MDNSKLSKLYEHIVIDKNRIVFYRKCDNIEVDAKTLKHICQRLFPDKYAGRFPSFIFSFNSYWKRILETNPSNCFAILETKSNGGTKLVSVLQTLTHNTFAGLLITDETEKFSTAMLIEQ